MSEMSPAILLSELKTSFIEGWRRTLTISSPSFSSGCGGVPGCTSRRKSPRMLSLRLVMLASLWSANSLRILSQTLACEVA